jgi:hypothetical protein
MATTGNQLVRLAQIMGIVGSSALSGTPVPSHPPRTGKAHWPSSSLGAILSISFISMPALASPAPDAGVSAVSPQDRSSRLAQTWQLLYNRGSSIAPPLAILSSTAWAFLAYTAPAGGNPLTRRLFVGAAACTAGIVPFTIGFMKRTNDALSAKARANGTGKSLVVKDDLAQTEGLLGKWMALNALRGALPLVGAILGATAVI